MPQHEESQSPRRPRTGSAGELERQEALVRREDVEQPSSETQIDRRCRVSVRYPNGQSRSFIFDGPQGFIGRVRGNDVRLVYPYIAPRHLKVSFVDQGFALTDLGSVEGTLFQGERLDPQNEIVVSEGEEIGIGPLRLSFESIYEATVVSEGGDAPSRPMSRLGPHHEESSIHDLRMAGGEPWIVAPPEDSPSGAFEEDPYGSETPTLSVPWMGLQEQIVGGRPKTAAKPSTQLPWFLMLEVLGGGIAFVALAFLIAILLL